MILRKNITESYHWDKNWMPVEGVPGGLWAPVAGMGHSLDQKADRNKLKSTAMDVWPGNSEQALASPKPDSKWKEEEQNTFWLDF